MEIRMGNNRSRFYSNWLRRIKSLLRSNGDVPSGRPVCSGSSVQEANRQFAWRFHVRNAWVDELASWVLHEHDYKRLLASTYAINRLGYVEYHNEYRDYSKVLGGQGRFQAMVDLHRMADASLGSRLLLWEPFMGSRRCDSSTCHCRYDTVDVQRERAMAILDSLQRY